MGNIKNNSRTDLALEVREQFEKEVEIKGVILNENYNKEKDIKISEVIIKDKNGSKIMGKPVGNYITIEAKKLNSNDESYHKPISEEIAKYIKLLTSNISEKEVLVVGLGNKDITPDSLGPDVVDNLFITRHLAKEFGEDFMKKHGMGKLSAIAFGVMAQTGMESFEILRGIINETSPSLIIVIDALAARSMERLNTTIQITDTGINPGSGVGNNRMALNKENLGVDVIAIGVPTVVDANTIVNETIWKFMQSTGIEEQDIKAFLDEINTTSVENMFVTPKDIDSSIKTISFTISEAINMCIHK